MLEETRDTITVPASLMIRMLASLNQIRRGQFAHTRGCFKFFLFLFRYEHCFVSGPMWIRIETRVDKNPGLNKKKQPRWFFWGFYWVFIIFLGFYLFFLGFFGFFGVFFFFLNYLYFSLFHSIFLFISQKILN